MTNEERFEIVKLIGPITDAVEILVNLQMLHAKTAAYSEHLDNSDLQSMIHMTESLSEFQSGRSRRRQALEAFASKD